MKPKAEVVLTGDRILEMSQCVREIPIASEVRRYGISLVMATHPDHELAAPITKKYVRYGSSPRGAQAIILGAKIKAILDNRFHVSKDDLRAMAPSVLRHRLILNFEGQAEGISTDEVIREILKSVKEPTA
ncbi:MAG: AAA family ATPase [Limisphaerales bacterium]